MTTEIRLRIEAERDLVEAARWYEEQQQGLGQEFLNELLATLSTIAEMPSLYAVVHRSTRRALMHRFPFGIFYRIDKDRIVVLAVNAREPSPSKVDEPLLANHSAN
jgi:plasmid stabilization system protein ParE